MSLIIAPDHHLGMPAMAARPRVYVIDDDVSIRDSLDLLIRDQGWDPLLFESAHEFMALEPASVPSCIVLDVHLPDLNGLDLQRQISTISPAAPIIFVTGYGDVPTTVRGLRAG